MKKVLGIVAIALFALSFASCKKDYNCTCTDSVGTVTTIAYTKVKKADAEDACSTSSTLWALAGGSCTLN